MISQKITSNRKNDIGEIIPHIVQTACAFKSSITFEVEDKRVNAKSIMGVMNLVPYNGDTLTVTAEGTDEDNAAEAIAEFFSK